MLNDGNFRDNLVELIDNPGAFTKEELYEAFLEVTERYLNEMINTMAFERKIIEEFGEEGGNHLIEKIATSDPATAELDTINATETDKKEVIQNLLTHVEFDFGIDIEGPGDDDFPTD